MEWLQARREGGSDEPPFWAGQNNIMHYLASQTLCKLSTSHREITVVRTKQSFCRSRLSTSRYVMEQQKWLMLNVSTSRVVSETITVRIASKPEAAVVQCKAVKVLRELIQVNENDSEKNFRAFAPLFTAFGSARNEPTSRKSCHAPNNVRLQY